VFSGSARLFSGRQSVLLGRQKRTAEAKTRGNGEKAIARFSQTFQSQKAKAADNS